MDSMAYHSWTPRVSRDFGEAIVKARHSFQESELFGDEALAALIERHPRELLELRSVSAETGESEPLSVEEVADMSGLQLLAAAHQGKLRILLRRAMNIYPEYRDLIREAFADLRKLESRFRPARFSGGILISSPSVRDERPAERDDVMVWQVRGARPAGLLPFQTMRGAPANDQSPRIEYGAMTEREARSFGLVPGEAHPPHLVGGLSVSVVTQVSDWRSALSNGVYFTNVQLRRRFGRSNAA